jgi:hypothetical protein
MAPQAGFEPATLRLTEAIPKIDRVRPSATKMMRISDLRAASEPASTSVDHGKRWWIVGFLRGYVTIGVTHQNARSQGHVSPDVSRHGKSAPLSISS